MTEGEDKPVKYPAIYDTADLALLTKVDIAGVVGFDIAMARRSIEQVRPGLEVVLSSARSGEGMAVWIERLVQGRAAAREHAHEHAHEHAQAHTHAHAAHSH